MRLCTHSLYNIYINVIKYIALFWLQFYLRSMLQRTESKSIAWRVCLRNGFAVCVIYIFICLFSLSTWQRRWCTTTRTFYRTHARTQPINTLWLLIVCCLLSLLHYSFSRTFASIPFHSIQFLVLRQFCHFYLFRSDPSSCRSITFTLFLFIINNWPMGNITMSYEKKEEEEEIHTSSMYTHTLQIASVSKSLFEAFPDTQLQAKIKTIHVCD